VARGPAFWRGGFDVEEPGDTFLDLRAWSKGVVWVNGRCLGRFWNIGPTQTAYLPGPWLKQGANEIVVLDFLGPRDPVVGGLAEPILDELRPRLDLAARASARELTLRGAAPDYAGRFAPGEEPAIVMFEAPLSGRQFCLEALNAHDGRPDAAIAELDLLDQAGHSLSHEGWTIAYADSEETTRENGAAINAINGQTASFWHTEWSHERPNYPHQIVIDLAARVKISGFRYLPRRGNRAARIKDYRIFVGDKLAG
jgi:beta-galactosidase